MGDEQPDPVRLGALTAAIVARLPESDGPRIEAPRPAPVRAQDHPLVRTVLQAFPGAVVVDVRSRDRR